MILLQEIADLMRLSIVRRNAIGRAFGRIATKIRLSLNVKSAGIPTTKFQARLKGVHIVHVNASMPHRASFKFLAIIVSKNTKFTQIIKNVTVFAQRLVDLRRSRKKTVRL